MEYLIAYLILSQTANAGTIGQDFVPYVKRFAKEAELRKVKFDTDRVRNVSISFGFNLNDYNALAYCDVGNHEIKVSESYWLTASDSAREELLFHELGHCLLNRAHDDGTMSLGNGRNIYKSIMNTYGSILMYKFCDDTKEDCGYPTTIMWPIPTQDGYAVLFSPKSKNNFYNVYHKIYMDELFGVVAPNVQTVKPIPVQKPIIKIKKGMTKREIVSILGEPESVYDGWVFHYRGQFCQMSTCTVVFNDEGVVASLNYFKPKYLDYLN